MEKRVDGFVPMGGAHCITNALKQVFNFYNCPMTEDMMFGIASGLAFTYINLANSPMVSGRTKPFEFEKKLAERLNIVIKCKTSKNYETVCKQAKSMIDKNQPVLIYVDMAFLKYLGLNKDSHFGGHAIVITGYKCERKTFSHPSSIIPREQADGNDDENEIYYVSDRDSTDYPIRTPIGDIAKDYHVVTYADMKAARSSSFRPFPANNKYLIFDFEGICAITGETIREAIIDTCGSMLNPPANLLGINGIDKFSKEVCKWNTFTEQKLRLAGITNYFQINKDGGTGGGIFRKMYGGFLLEANTILTDIGLDKMGNQFILLAKNWDVVADIMWKLSECGDRNLLKTMSNNIHDLYEEEKWLLLRLQEVVQ